jgi:hypothetical protein
LTLPAHPRDNRDMIHGTRVYRTECGWAAEHCPICHGPRVCRVTAVQSFHHVNWIKAGAAGPVLHMLTCPDCELRWLPGGDGQRQLFQHPERAAEALDDPDFQAWLAERAQALELVDEAGAPRRVDPLRADSPVLEETLYAVQNAWELREWLRPPLAGVLGALFILLVVALLLGIGVMCLLLFKNPATPQAFGLAGTAAIVILGLYVAFRWSRDRWFVRRTLLPLIGRGLGPFRPAEDALAAIPDFFRRIKSPLRRYLPLQAIRDAVLTARSAMHASHTGAIAQ